SVGGAMVFLPNLPGYLRDWSFLGAAACRLLAVDTRLTGPRTDGDETGNTPSAQKASYPSFMQTTPDVGISSNLSSERLARHARRIVVNDAASSAWTIATTSESCSPSSWQDPP